MSMFPEEAIDRQSPLPFYFQLAELLEQEIVNGRLEDGTRVNGQQKILVGGQQFSKWADSRTPCRRTAVLQVGGRGAVPEDSWWFGVGARSQTA
jgi:hypothetical protein